MIENIVEGMKAVQVFDILNRLIDEHNQLMAAVGGALVDGAFDYKALVNKPAINGIELSGDVNPADLVMGVDNAVLEKVNNVSRQLQDYQTERNGYVQRLGQLESGRTADLQRISTLEGSEAARNQSLNDYISEARAERIQFRQEYRDASDVNRAQAETLATERAQFRQQFTEYRASLSSDVAAAKSEMKAETLDEVASKYATIDGLNQLDIKKADVANTPTTQQWQVMKADMDAKATAAGNAKTAAENAMADKASDTQFKEVADRVIKLINRVNMVADAVVLLEDNGCTFGRQTMHDASGGKCLSDISNTFTFDVN